MKNRVAPKLKDLWNLPSPCLLIIRVWLMMQPDVAAPGVNILAAYSPVEAGTSNGFAFLSGTSMACPHVSGLAALIKSAHPTWSPAAIRSALVTSGQ